MTMSNGNNHNNQVQMERKPTWMIVVNTILDIFVFLGNSIGYIIQVSL